MNIHKLLLALLIFTFSTAPSLAVETQGNASKQDIEYANNHLNLTDKFGKFKVAYVIKNPSTPLLIEYLPQDDEIESWTTLATLSVFPCTDDKAICNALSQKLATHFVSDSVQLGFQKKIIDKKIWTSAPPQSLDTSPHVAYFHYTIGEGNIKENNTGVLYVDKNTINIFQLQKRATETLSSTDLKIMKDMAQDYASKMNLQ